MASPVPSCEFIDTNTRRDLIDRLFRLGAVNFDGVVLKTGEISPVYFDIRLTMSDPTLLYELSSLLWKMVVGIKDPGFDLVAGVPAAAIPLSTALSIQNNLPMILCRKASKDYGTKKVIEGIWKPGQNCLVVEDVVTYGDSIAETTELLRSAGLIVKHAVVVVERQQGATEALATHHNVQLHALLTFNDLLTTLLEDGRICEERVRKATLYNAKWQYSKIRLEPPPAIHFAPLLGVRLHEAMKSKSSRLCLVLDKPVSSSDLVMSVERTTSRLCALLVNPDLVTDFSFKVARKLRQLANLTNFILIYDRKLADTGSVVFSQLTCGLPKTTSWCDAITVHALPGPNLFEALRIIQSAAVGQSAAFSAIVVADLEDSDSLIDSDYQSQCAQLALKYPDVVLGFISYKPLDDIIRANIPETDVPNVFYLVPEASANDEIKVPTSSRLDAFRTNVDGVLLCSRLSLYH